MQIITSLRLALVLVLVVAACTVALAHDFVVNGIYYERNRDGASVTVTYEGASYDMYDDKKYTVLMWCNYWIMPLYCMSAFEQRQHIMKAIITSIQLFFIVGINLPHKYSAFPEYSQYLSCKKKNKSTYDSN